MENNDDLERRRSNVRRRQLLLALEQWAPAQPEATGPWLDYVCDIADADAQESAWLKEHVAQNGLPAGTALSAGEWHDVRRAQGRQANAAASAAFLAGDYARAHDLVDNARAYGAVLETEWRKLHEFIAAKAAEAAPAT